jgi:hypothetical protein
MSPDVTTIPAALALHFGFLKWTRDAPVFFSSISSSLPPIPPPTLLVQSSHSELRQLNCVSRKGGICTLCLFFGLFVSLLFE